MRSANSLQTQLHVSTKHPPALTDREHYLLNHCLQMDEYWFKALFLSEDGRIIEEPIISWNVEGKGKNRIDKPNYAIIVAKDAIKTYDDGKQDKTIYGFFIHYKRHVWKSHSMLDVASLLEALRKRDNSLVYEDKMRLALRRKTRQQKKCISHKKSG